MVNDWYLYGYCRLRHGRRVFRLSRISDLALLDYTFGPTAVSPAEWIKPNMDKVCVIHALFDPAVTQWVRESRIYYMVAEEETADGLLVTLHARREEEVFQWLLSWGGQVKVLEPVSLQQKLVAAARQIIQNYE
jgi:predicted DNA-binding transcriptional regulator YafY